MISPVFLAHGSPYTIFEKSRFTEFLNRFGKETRPKALIIFSAHFESEITTISATDDIHEMVYDYYGFPPEYYQVQYPAKGSVAVALMVEERLRMNNIEVQQKYRGLDHGVYTILLHIWAEADIPVIPISINPFLPPKDQMAIGAALKGLEDDNILVMGSGFLAHNLREVNMAPNAQPDSWAVEFLNWIREKTLAGDTESLLNYELLAPYAKKAVPRPEHFVPFLIALGSGSESRSAVVLYEDTIRYGSLGELSFKF